MLRRSALQFGRRWRIGTSRRAAAHSSATDASQSSAPRHGNSDITAPSRSWSKRRDAGWREYSSSIGFNPAGVLHQGINEAVEAVDIPSDIVCDRLTVTRATHLKEKPPLDAAKLKFGAEYTDHMLQITWKEGVGWGAPTIDPLGPMSIHPCAQVLHYGLECFEGMKAFKGEDGRIRLFRPHMNMDRLFNSATRLAFPPFDKEGLLDCIKALLRVERDWIPDRERFSLYIRPTIISTYPHLGVGPPREAVFFCVLSPVGPYFDTELNPIKLLVDKTHVRAFPGGIGDAKVGGNYAPTILPQLRAMERGCSQVLYVLDEGSGGGLVGESGAMNVFFLFRKGDELELVTPVLDGVILPGVTRDTVLALVRGFGNIRVSERRLLWDEIEEAAATKSILEIFGTGTACMIQPIMGLVRQDNSEIIVPFDQDAASHWTSKAPGSSAGSQAGAGDDEPFSLCGRLTRAILDIQYGHVNNSNWSVVVD